MDIFSQEKRSQIMSRISGKNTEPEIIVRSLIHKMGYRFRLHRRDLPGKPDIVLTKYKKVIFVNGCFWHGHEGCSRAKRPTSNQNFWNEKLDKNIKRDTKNLFSLELLGWRTLVIWQCQTKNEKVLKKILTSFLDGE